MRSLSAHGTVGAASSDLRVDTGLKIFVQVYSTIVQRTPTTLERVPSICEAPNMRSFKHVLNRVRFTHIWSELSICSMSSAARDERVLGDLATIVAAAALRPPITFDKTAIQSRQTQGSHGTLSVRRSSDACITRRRRASTLRSRHFGRIVGRPQEQSAP